jgi:hypothetical protein
MNQSSSINIEDTVELIFADYDNKNITVFEAMDRAEKLIEEQTNRAVIGELETLRKSVRGEDPDQYRPRDMVSKGLVEEIIDAHLATLQLNQTNHKGGKA